MRIVIDMQGAQTESRYRGIGRYTMAFAKAVVRNRGDDEVVLALNGLFPEAAQAIRREFDGLLPGHCIRTWSSPGPVRDEEPRNGARRVVAEKLREAFLASLAPDIVHVASLFEGFLDDAVTSIGTLDVDTPVTAILYDLIPYLNQEQYLAHNPAYRDHYLRKIASLRKAARLLAISGFSREEGCQALGLDQGHVVTISTAIDPHFTAVAAGGENAAQVLARFDLQRPFVLYTGGSDGRKNLPRMIEAYARLDKALRAQLQLVLAGKMSASDVDVLRGHAVAHALGPDELVFTGYVTDEELVALYRTCRCFMFPSWHEGFGLPALEAMACGAPVIGSNTTSIVEVIDLPEAMFDPFDVTAMATTLHRCLTEERFRQRLIEHGSRQTRRFSWDTTAQRAWSAWRDLAAARGMKATPPAPALRPTLALFSPLPPERSGIADYTAELLPELATYYRIDVIVTMPTVEYVLPDGVSYLSLEQFRASPKRYDRYLYQMGNSPFHAHMPDTLREHPGTVVLHDFFLSSLLQWQESAGGRPGIWSQALYRSHGYPAVVDKFHDAHAARHAWPSSFGVVADVHGVIVHSQYSRGLLGTCYGKHAGVVNIPLVRALAPPSVRAEARRRLGVPDGAFLVCSFGFLDYSKLNHVLIEAWKASALARDADCHLVFVGQNSGGDYGAQIAAEIARLPGDGRVRITGFASASEYRDWLEAADAAIQLRTQSRGETSAAVLDCMGRGLPLVINANGSMAEIDPAAAIVLVDDFEVGELAQALQTLHQDAALRLAMGEHGRRIIATQHAPALCARLYRDAIEGFHASATARRDVLLDALAEGGDLQGWDDGALRRLAADLASTFPQEVTGRRLLLDVTATAGTGLHTGIERVARALAAELLRATPPGMRVEPVRLVQEEGRWCYRHAHGFALQELDAHAPMHALAEDVVDPRPDDVLLGLDISGHALIEAEQSGLFARWRSLGVRAYYMIFDLLPILMPKVFPPGTEQSHAQWLAAVAKMDGALCISAAVAQDMRQWLLREHKDVLDSGFSLLTTPLGADFGHGGSSSSLPAEPDEVIEAMGQRPSVLMVGTIEPRKGYLQALQAFERLWQRGVDVNLVVVGREGWKGLPEDMRRDIPETVRALQSSVEAGRRLFWLSDASDGDLERAYAAASGLLAASYGEGFGLPLIEAAAKGLALCVRDIPVFREVAGPAAFYFDAATPEALADAVQVWLALFARGQHPVSAGLAYKSWQASAHDLLQALVGPTGMGLDAAHAGQC